jgi:hypothetical protein
MLFICPFLFFFELSLVIVYTSSTFPLVFRSLLLVLVCLYPALLSVLIVTFCQNFKLLFLILCREILACIFHFVWLWWIFIDLPIVRLLKVEYLVSGILSCGSGYYSWAFICSFNLFISNGILFFSRAIKDLRLLRMQWLSMTVFIISMTIANYFSLHSLISWSNLTISLRLIVE